MKRCKIQEAQGLPEVVHKAAVTPTIYRLIIERFRGIETPSWYPAVGVNVILGGGDVGKTTVLDAIALLLGPTNLRVSPTETTPVLCLA